MQALEGFEISLYDLFGRLKRTAGDRNSSSSPQLSHSSNMPPAAQPLRQLGHHDSRGSSTQSKSKSLSDLPHEVLVVLMQHVPLQQRLAVCARLSNKFSRAAAAATTSIKHHATSISTVYSLDAYLQAHGSAVLSIDLKPLLTAAKRLPYALQRLPCPGLLRLQLTDTLVQLTAIPGSQHPGILASCSGLTCLSLLNCNVLDRSEQLGGLSVLQGLQELVVTWGPDCSRRTSQPLTLLPGSLLSQLVHLKHVYLSSPTHFASLEHLSCVTGLQEFQVTLAAGAQQERFSGVHHLQQLTSLSVSGYFSQQSIGFNETPGLCQLTTLQALDVWACKAFRPSVLQQMSSLRCLIIRKTALPGGAEGTSALLRALPHLTAVTCLDLAGTLQHPAVQLEDYTALACLSNLEGLVLSECNLPAGLRKQLEETGMPMRSVWSLVLDDSTCEPLDTAGLSSLVKCFPSLTGLSCVNATKAGTQWTPLQQLLSLQAVHMSGVSDADVPVLTSLQQLTALKVLAPSSITDLGLLRLTALSRLQQLEVSGNLSAALAGGGSVLLGQEDSNQVSADQGPIVAMQLMRLCIRSSACQPVLLEQMEELQQALQGAEDELVESRTAVQAREAAAAALEKQLQEKGALLEVREQRLKARNKQAADKERSTANRSRQVAADLKAAAAKEQQLAATKAELDARARSLDQREQQLNQRHSAHQQRMQPAGQPVVQAPPVQQQPVMQAPHVQQQMMMQVPPWRHNGQQQQVMMGAPHVQQQPVMQVPPWRHNGQQQQVMMGSPHVQQQPVMQVQPMMQGMMAGMQQVMMGAQQMMQGQQGMGQAPYMFAYNSTGRFM